MNTRAKRIAIQMLHDNPAQRIADLKKENTRLRAILDVTNQDILLSAGEMNVQELRTVRAVLNMLKRRMEMVE